ncbi:MAG: DUF58 domain-containing protein [Thermodesulfobacteriota bacterium]
MKAEDFLDEEFLRKLERVRLLAARAIKGPRKGEHRSWRSGTSLEFLDYRKYQPGDDVRYVDWNVYGRLDKLFLKLFRSEEDLSVHFLLDRSGSMSFGSPSKIFYSQKMAAALGYIALSNLDNVDFVSFSDSLKESSNRHKGKRAYPALLGFLKQLKPEGETGVSPSLESFAVTCSRPGLAVILSDFLDSNGLEKGLEALRQRKFKTIFIQVLDHEELSPSLDGFLLLKEMETSERKRITLTAELRYLYQKKMEEFLAGIRELCLIRGVEYYLLDTRIPFEDFLFGELLAGKLFR